MARAGRGARVGTKAGRIVRIVRMLRFVRIVKLYKHAHHAIGEDGKEMAQLNPKDGNMNQIQPVITVQSDGKSPNTNQN